MLRAARPIRRPRGPLSVGLLSGLVASILALTAIAAAFGVYGAIAPEVAASGTPIVVTTYGSDSVLASTQFASSQTPLSGVSIVVTSAVPQLAAGGTEFAIPGSGGVVQVFSGVSGSSGVVSATLGPSFIALAQEWSQVEPVTAQVSLSIQATYTVAHGSTASVYTAFNSIVLNPRDPQSALIGEVSLDLAKPAYVEPVTDAEVGEASTPCVAGVGECIASCASGGTETQTINSSYVTGPFPLAMEFDQATSNPDLMLFSQASMSGSWQFGFSGASFTQSSTYVTFGTSPSFSESGVSLSGSGASVAATSSSSTSVGLLYVNNVTLFVENTRPASWVTTGIEPDCTTTWTYGHITTQVEISSIQSAGGAISIISRALPATWGQFIVDALKLTPSGSPISIPAGQSYSFLSGQMAASGYSNMNSVASGVLNALSLFTSALGMGLALMDAADLFPFYTGEGISLAETVSLMASQVGLETSVVQAFTTISWSETLSVSLQQVTLTNEIQGSGAGMEFTFYQAGGSTSTEFAASSDPVASMPLPLVLGQNT
jgi:hypothetical protein